MSCISALLLCDRARDMICGVDSGLREYAGRLTWRKLDVNNWASIVTFIYCTNSCHRVVSPTVPS